MVKAQRLPSGRILAPVTLTGTVGGGDYLAESSVELAPGDPGYAEWDQWLAGREADEAVKKKPAAPAVAAMRADLELRIAGGLNGDVEAKKHSYTESLHRRDDQGQWTTG